MELLSGVVVTLLALLGVLYIIGQRTMKRQDKRHKKEFNEYKAKLKEKEKAQREQTKRIMDSIGDDDARQRMRDKYEREKQ